MTGLLSASESSSDSWVGPITSSSEGREVELLPITCSEAAGWAPMRSADRVDTPWISIHAQPGGQGQDI